MAKNVRCPIQSFEMRSVKTNINKVQKTMILTSIDSGPEKVVFVMRTNSSPKGSIPGYSTLMQTDFEIDMQIRVLTGLYEQNLVMNQLQKNFQLSVPHADGHRLLPIARVKNGVEAESLLAGRKAMIDSMERNGDDGEAYLAEKLSELTSGGTANSVDLDNATLARKAIEREPIRVTTDAYGLAPDHNPTDEALRIAAQYMKTKGEPKYKEMSIEDLMALVRKEMYADLLGGNPKDACAEIIMCGVRLVDEKLTLRELLKAENSFLWKENPDLRQLIKAYDQKVTRTQVANPNGRGFNELASASTVEELDELLKKVELGHLGVAKNRQEDIDLRELIRERRNVEARLAEEVERIKSLGYSFHHSAKAKPTKLEADGFQGGLKTEAQIINNKVHETKLIVTDPARTGPRGGVYPERNWTENFIKHFGGAGVYQRALGVYYK